MADDPDLAFCPHQGIRESEESKSAEEERILRAMTRRAPAGKDKEVLKKQLKGDTAPIDKRFTVVLEGIKWLFLLLGILINTEDNLSIHRLPLSSRKTCSSYCGWETSVSLWEC